MAYTQENLAAKVEAEEDLDISIERVDKLRAPLLVIGLGGSGGDVVKTIKHTFAERYNLPKDENGKTIPVPENTAYLVIDSDAMAMSDALADSEFVNITVSGMQAVLDPKLRDHNLKPYEREWVNARLDSASNGLGAGTNRQAARLMLSRNYGRVRAAISGALLKTTRIQQGDAGNLGQANIVIATGLSGGTGSGTFLDIAQIVRHCMATDSSLSNLKYRITGYLIMPDISLQVLDAGHPLESVFKHNAYAALMELDFWMRVGDHHTQYAAQFGDNETVSWALPPFNACVLMCGTTVNGDTYENAYNVVQRTIAENLLHYLANEEPSDVADGASKYSYISYEDNLTAAVTALPKELPLHYAYRSIGAYTMRIPKKKLLYYEGTRLFQTFVPPRDRNNRLVPNGSLNDGMSAKRAQDIAGVVKEIYDSFMSKVPLPTFCNVQPGNDAQVAAMQRMSPPPHDCADRGATPWRSSVVEPSANKLADAYLGQMWENFTKFAKFTITDPRLGPFSLREYLREENGTLVSKLNELLTNWQGTAKNFEQSIESKYQACVNTWNAFRKPPLLGKGGALTAYLTNLRTLYDGIRKMHFMYAYAERLKKLVQRVNDYRDYALAAMCRDILKMEAEFGKGDQDDSVTAGEVFDFSTVKDKLDQEFAVNNQDDRIGRLFLADLCDASFAVTPNADAHSSGVSFLFANVSMESLRESLRGNLEKCFGDVNSESLDAILTGTVGEDPQRQRQEMDRLSDIILTNSKPMFAQSNVRTSDPVATYSYLSVPSDAPKYLKRYKEELRDKAQAKSSSIHDHIYCVTAWDGLPLYRYNLLESLKQAYYQDLNNNDLNKAIHLVWNGDIDAPYTQNWTKLPSPCPYFFFRPEGVGRETLEYKRKQNLVARALRCGLLAIDDSLEKPAYTLRLQYVDAGRVTAKSSAMIRKEVDEILALRDPATGNLLASDKLLPLLEKHRGSGHPDKALCSVSPLCMQVFKGLKDAPCNPFSASTQANPEELEAAKKNHRILSVELVTALLSMRPKEGLLLEQQIEGMEYLQQRIDEIHDKANRWQPRIDYAPTAAHFLMSGLLSTGFNGYQYTDGAGNMLDLMQPQLMKDDLAEMPQLLQGVAYLGDLVPENEVRRALETMYGEQRDALVRRQKQKNMTAEELGVLLAGVTRLKEQCAEESRAAKAEKLKMNADVKLIDKKLELYDKIANAAGNEESLVKSLLASL